MGHLNVDSSWMRLPVAEDSRAALIDFEDAQGLLWCHQQFFAMKANWELCTVICPPQSRTFFCFANRSRTWPAFNVLPHITESCGRQRQRLPSVYWFCASNLIAEPVRSAQGQVESRDLNVTANFG